MSPDQPRTTAERLRRRTARLAILFVLIVAAVLGVGAWQLAQSQASDREDLRVRYDDRAKVAAALTDSLFTLAFQQSAQQSADRFSGDIDPLALERFAKRSQALYLAVLAADGRVLGATSGAPSDPGAGIVATAAKTGFALSDVRAVDGTQAVESAARFASPEGVRLLVSASPLRTFKSFLSGSLRPLAPLEGGEAYVLDGAGAVVGATSKIRPDRPPPPSQELIDLVGRAHGFYSDHGQEQYFASTPLPHSGWHVVVSAPLNAIYAPAQGVGHWLPWVILGVLAVALVAIGVLARRAVLAGAQIAQVNARLAVSEERLRERAAELERANEELSRSNADLEQFAYVASHDLSAPLRAVAGFSQLLGVRYKGRLDADADEFIDHMQDGVSRMQRIIDDLLAYSRVDRGGLDAERVDLDAVLGEVLHALRPEIAERGAEVTHDPLGSAYGDAGQLSQVLQNLVSNGMKFTGDGVRPAVHVGAARGNGRVQISVRDNGIGIDPENAERIFKMFQRLHSADDYPGTGIGLAICQKIVERHGGTIAVAPAPGGGSVFTFDIPAEMPR